MKKDIKDLLTKLEKEQNLEMVLPQYANELMTDYYQYSLVGLTMHYYVLYEMAQENENYRKDSIGDNLKQLNDIIARGIIADFDGVEREKCITKIESLRNEVLSKMDVIVDYVEKFLVYQYILNRTEYRFDTSESEIGSRNVPDNEVAANIYKYIFAVQDNMVINDKIKMIIGQLPVRMAKSKFYDLISNSLSLYKGSDVSSTDSFVYSIRSAAMLYTPKQADMYFTEIRDELEYFAGINYADINKEQFKEAEERLKNDSDKLNMYTDMYCALQDVINEVYSVLLSLPYANGSDLSVLDNNICYDVIKKVYDSFETGDYADLSADLTTKLTLIEGRQERIYFSYSQLESELFSITSEQSELIESLMLTNQFKCLDKCQMLLSSSSFVELNEKPKDNMMADEEYIEKEKGQLISEISDFMSDASQPVRRAVMANVLNKLPVFFGTSNEIMEYINNSLSSCKDEAEKNASIDLIMQMIYEDDGSEYNVE